MAMDSAAQTLVDSRQINHAAARKLKASRWPCENSVVSQFEI
jgi:hypothetical protein